MSGWRLYYQGQPFVLQQERGALNTGAVFPAEELQLIRQEAFADNKILQQSSALVLPAMFAAGLCTGMSGWTLLHFAQQTDGLDEWHHSAVLQARILRTTIWRQALADYTAEPDHLIERLINGLQAEDYQEFPLLMIIPRIGNIMRLAEAHTLVPYQISSQGNLFQIWVYDCNSPGNPQRMIKWDRLSGCWKYEQFHSGQWYLSILPLKLLL